jgi:hypothetical protein
MRYLFLLAIGIQATFTVSLGGGERSSKPAFRVLIVLNSGSSKLHGIDGLKIKKSFENITQSLKAPIDLKIIEQRDFLSRSVRRWSKRIRPTDIEVVYYSGPYAENPGYNGSWPSICLSTKVVPVGAISDIIGARPRLSLVIADCYDKIEKTAYAIRRPVGAPFKKTHSPYRVAKLKKNWMKIKGNLTLCSQGRGERGYGVVLGHQYSGGVFTEAVLRELAYGKLREFPKDLQMYMATPLASAVQNIVYVSSLKG